MVIAGREAAPTFSASAPRPAFLYIIISNGPFDCRELSYLLQFLMIYLIPQLSKARDQKWTFFAVQSDLRSSAVLCPIIFYLSIGCYFCNFEENRRGIIGNQNKMITFEAQTNKGGQNMELQTVKAGKERLIASGASMDGISIRRTGIAKVLWRKLDVDVPKSEVIANARMSSA